MAKKRPQIPPVLSENDENKAKEKLEQTEVVSLKIVEIVKNYNQGIYLFFIGLGVILILLILWNYWSYRRSLAIGDEYRQIDSVFFLKESKENLSDKTVTDMRNLKQLIKQDPTNQDIIFMTAFASGQANQWANAYQLYQQYIQQNPSRQPFCDFAKYNQVNAALNSGDNELLQDVFKKLDSYLMSVRDEYIKPRLQLTAALICLILEKQSEAEKYLKPLVLLKKEEELLATTAENLLQLMREVPSGEWKSFLKDFPSSLVQPVEISSQKEKAN